MMIHFQSTSNDVGQHGEYHGNIETKDGGTSQQQVVIEK
jgi:hypothetical protein